MWYHVVLSHRCGVVWYHVLSPRQHSVALWLVVTSSHLVCSVFVLTSSHLIAVMCGAVQCGAMSVVQSCCLMSLGVVLVSSRLIIRVM